MTSRSRPTRWRSWTWRPAASRRVPGVPGRAAAQPAVVARRSQPVLPGRSAAGSPTSTGPSWRAAASPRSRTSSPASAGITATSPALTVAQRSGRLMLQRVPLQGIRALRRGRAEPLAGETVVRRRCPGSRGVLPPAERTLGAGEAADRPRHAACRPTRRSHRRSPTSRAGAHLRGPAVARRGLERVRHLRRRRRVAVLERPAGEPQPDHRTAGERRHQGRHRAGRLSEHRPPLQLGGASLSRCPTSPAASPRAPAW